MNNLLLDNLFARRPKIHYVAPPVGCAPTIIPSSSGSAAISIDLGEPVVQLPCVNYRLNADNTLEWDAFPNAICYNVYMTPYLPPPVITTQPSAQSVLVGDTVVLSVVATGAGPITYQWLKNGVPISGETSSSLTLSNVTTAATGNYSVVVSNPTGPTGSDTVTVSVNTPPSIVTPPSSLTLLAGATANFSVVAAGDPVLLYQWKKNAVDLGGQTAASLSIAGVSAVANAGNYTVSVTNPFGSVVSPIAVLAINTPPSIVTQPASQSVADNATVTFTVVAAGDPVLTYQWKKNTVDIGGQTASSLVLSNVHTVPDNGSYTVVVTNAFGSVTSAAAVLTVGSPAIIPSAFPNLAAWWKADSLALSDGTQVGQSGVTDWLDQSGNNRTLTSTVRPIFKTNIVGTKPVVRFSAASNQVLNWTSSISPANNDPFTIIIIGSVTGDSIFLTNGLGGNIQIRRLRSGVNNISKYFQSTDQQSSVFSSSPSALVAMIWRRDSSGNGTFRENTTARGTYSDGASLILNRISGPGFNMLDGDVAEICIYTGLLSDADVDSLYVNYFKPRWVTLP